MSSQFPDVDTREVAFVGNGWQFEVYSVGDRMFRFPRYADVKPWFDREIALMPVIAAALDTAVPRFDLIGEPSAAFPYTFVGYRRIQGVEANRCSLADGFARDIALAYSQLHAIDPASIPQAPSSRESETLEDWRTFDEEEAAIVTAALPAEIAKLAAPYLARAVPPPVSTGTRRAIHNDIGTDHVLVDPPTGRLSGIIDWTDMVVGDSAIDFAHLITLGDRAFADEVLLHYGGEIDETFLERMSWASKILSLVWILDARTALGSVPDEHLRYVARAFA